MTIDEAIRHCEEVAEQQRAKALNINPMVGIEAAECIECAADHRQLAEWLRELKELREENKVLISECDRLIKEKGELLSKVSGAVEAADVQPVKHGRWIAENRDNRGYANCYTCTNCNCYTYTYYTLMKDYEYDYCPNCGARMDGDAK